MSILFSSLQQKIVLAVLYHNLVFYQVCAVRVIAESDAVQEFLTDSDDSSNPTPVDLKVLLPDKEVVTVSVLKSTNADDVYRAVCEKIGLSKSVQKYFYLFEIVEYNFGE